MWSLVPESEAPPAAKKAIQVGDRVEILQRRKYEDVDEWLRGVVKEVPAALQLTISLPLSLPTTKAFPPTMDQLPHPLPTLAFHKIFGA